MRGPLGKTEEDPPRRKFSHASRKKIPWSDEEIRNLKSLYSREPIPVLVPLFPSRNWGSISKKARTLGLRRPRTAPLSITLKFEGDIGYCAGMVIADGSVLEACIKSGVRRAKSEGGTARPRRYYSMPQVRVSMEDKESLERVGRLWGRKVVFCQTSSTGNSVWSVQIGGKKAKELLLLMLPYLAGPKRKKALFLLEKYADKTSLPVKARGAFVPFSGMK